MKFSYYFLLLLCLFVAATVVGQQAVADGVAAFEHGDKTKAKLLFRQALKKDPRNVEAHTYLGMLAADANEIKEAEQHFAAAASLAPSEPSTRNNYGAILMRLGRTAQARIEFEASLKLNPDQPSALTNLAQIYFDRGQPADLQMARELLEHAAKITSDPEISRALVVTVLSLARAQMLKNDLHAAGRTLESAVASGLDDAKI